MILALVTIAITGYLFGSINSALIVSRLTHRADIRSRGSGNAGATNMFRSYGKWAGLATLSGDLIKAVLAVLLARTVFNLSGQVLPFDSAYVTGLFVLTGHIYPVFFSFKGGKGVMPAVGIILMADPLAFAILLVIAVVVFLVTRTMSLVSLISAGILPLLTLTLAVLRNDNPLGPVLLTLAYTILVFYAHRGNIARLRAGTEKAIK